MPVSMKHGGGGSEDGIVLLAVAAIILIASICMIFGLGVFKTQDIEDRIYRTNFREAFVIRELSAYVQRMNVMPCPADPTVDPATSGFGKSKAVCDTTATAEGIVPFRTLGLNQFDALDGWGHFMTYRISPVLAMSKAVIPPSGDPKRVIFDRCRRFPWFDHSPTATPYNVYAEKALFCCPPMAGGGNKDLVIKSSAAAATTLNNIARTGASYADLDTSTGYSEPYTAADSNKEDLFAVAIISHGQNGIGAYVTGGGRLGNVASAGTDEQENINNDELIVSAPLNMTTGASHFDDIVTWRTQTTLMGELNNASCYLPWK